MQVDKPSHEAIAHSPEVGQFLRDPTSKKLQIKYNHKTHKVACAVDQGIMACSDAAEDALYLVKTSSADLRPQTFSQQVLVSSTHGSALTAFLDMVSEVYQPLLAKDGNVSEELKSLVATL